jgi:hypothetical protein
VKPDWVRDTNIQLLSSVLEYYSLSALNSFVIYVSGICPLFIASFWNSTLSGLALANEHLARGSARTYIAAYLALSSFRVILGTFCRSLPIAYFGRKKQPYWARFSMNGSAQYARESSSSPHLEPGAKLDDFTALFDK